MAPGRILFADNDKAFRSARAEFLRDDYDVLEAGSVQEVRQHLHEDRVHLALLDIRLENDNDDKDFSGLMLAQDETYKAVPKILLTGYPSLETLREALRDAMPGMPSAVDYLAKGEGHNAMLEAVATAFAKHVRINWELGITSDERQPLPSSYLVTLIEPNLESERLQRRADGLEDVLRRLFYAKHHIRLDRLLWQRNQRFALRILAFEEGTLPEAFVVVCGSSAAMANVAQRYAESAPKALESAGTVLSAQAETVHFAAHAYRLAGIELEHARPLIEVYRGASEKALSTALEHLVQQTLKTWHQDKRLRAEPPAFAELYRERLGWPAGHTSADLAASLQELAHQLPTLGITIEHTAAVLRVRLAEETWTYPHPSLLLQQPDVLDQPVLVMNTPGTFTGENVLTDARGHTWLTDFADAGLAPQIWNVAALEAMIRFDWVETHALHAFHSMERCLIEQAFHKFDTHDVEPALRKPLHAIQAVRRLATPLLGGEPVAYHLGLLYQALHRLRTMPPHGPWTPSELVRYGHIFLAAAMLYNKVKGETPGSTDSQATPTAGLRIDEANRLVWVNGVKVHVPGHSYDLLYYLYTRAGQLCTRRQLVEEVWRMAYDEGETSQVNRLNAAIRRLRERIEEDPGQPRYLHTESGHGYRLVKEATSSS